MSNYRDDMQSTAVASDSTWLGLTAITESSAKITATVLFGLMVAHCDSAIASDQVIDKAVHMVSDSAEVSEVYEDRLYASVYISGKALVSDSQKDRLRVLHTGEALASDKLIDKTLSTFSDSATASEKVFEQRTSRSVIADSAKASDVTFIYATDVLSAVAIASDSVYGKLTSREIATGLAVASDKVIDSHKTRPPILSVSAQAGDEVLGHLYASDIVSDLAITSDSLLGAGSAVGQAWTASVDSWAMSRYEPYRFTRIAVIDGIAYGESDDGVYALSGGVEQISGVLETGKIDLGGGQLVHPIASFLEYQLEGTAQMDVTTTQSGVPSTYTYILPEETAGHLTNGRFIFGRGLRGRHFSFALRLTGEKAEINDLSVEVAPTRRRV